MTNLNTIIEISNLCKKHNIDVRIDESGIVFSAYRNGHLFSKRYELEMLSKIVLDLPLEIIIDLFIEESVLQFKRAAY